MADHTPGPWKMDGEYRHPETKALLGVYIAKVDNGRVGQTFANCLASDAACIANARLIAAAPDLFEVVQALITCADMEYIANTSHQDSLGVLADAARAAIAKVREAGNGRR